VRVQRQSVGSVAALTDPVTLSQLLGHRVEGLRIEPLHGIGYSNASLSRIETSNGDGERSSLVLKRTRVSEDWTARRTQDSAGREALLLNECALEGVWDVFSCPYVACAAEPGEIGLLLIDLTTELMPDARVPLSTRQESTLLGALARLHARFWNLDGSAHTWLVRPAQYCDLLAPCVAADPTTLAVLSPPMQDAVSRGWASALPRVPVKVRRHLTCPGVDWERRWADVPWTLLHGDVKVANFAMIADGRVAAFDWALVGTGPCTVEMGWYLAVNASRLTGPKEEILRRYRELLETARASRLPDPVWLRLEEIAVVTGARMLLWSKALALELERPGALEEWMWWVDRLAAIGPDVD
jgi:hypothetical protein